MKKNILVTFVIFIFLISGRKYECRLAGFSLIFTGYSEKDIDTVILRKFTIGQNFVNVLDTTVITDDHYWFTYIPKNDTIGIFPLYYRSNDRPIAGFDWEVFIPSQNRTIKISNINIDGSTVSVKGHACPIISFMQDNRLIDAPPPASADDFRSGEFRMYISK